MCLFWYPNGCHPVLMSLASQGMSLPFVYLVACRMPLRFVAVTVLAQEICSGLSFSFMEETPSP